MLEVLLGTVTGWDCNQFVPMLATLGTKHGPQAAFPQSFLLCMLGTWYISFLPARLFSPGLTLYYAATEPLHILSWASGTYHTRVYFFFPPFNLLLLLTLCPTA